MSQYYPPQGPSYPPEQAPESDYYYDADEYDYEELDDSGGNNLLQSAAAFAAGGCVVFLCMSACAFFLGALWILDPGGSLVSSTPPPGSDIGLTFDEPAFPDESVVNEQQIQLTILDVNRNASVEAIPAVEGRETIVVTVELVNLGGEDTSFSERDFVLLNQFEDAYVPTVGAITGSLGRGELPPNEGLEGRLVFEVLADEVDLRLLWDPGQGNDPRFIYLE